MNDCIWLEITPNKLSENNSENRTERIFYNNNSQSNIIIKNNRKNSMDLRGENFDCVLTTTQLELSYSLK